MRFRTFMLILFLLVIPWSAQGEMCRWVDENGTVHYAEKCPEGVKGSGVRIDPGPTADQVRAAQEISRQHEQGRRDRDVAEPEPASSAQDSVSVEICIDATLAEDTLERPLPVYFDESGELHHGRSSHSQTYQGERRYLDDAERQAELTRVRQLISQHCGESKSDIIAQSEELKARIKVKLCTDYQAKAEQMIRSRQSGSADRARSLIEYCESDR